MRVGNESTPFSAVNTAVKTDMVEGGIFPIDPASGNFFTLRRDGPEPASGSSGLVAHEIRVYESRSLFDEFSGRINITPDTSSYVSGFEPENLINNL